MKTEIKSFRVREGEKVNLKHWPTKCKPLYKSKQDYQTILAEHVKRMTQRQYLLYADARRSVLLIFQAMDAAGKDGTIKHVMSGLNPQGCRVYSFKRPSSEDLAHDFLWRTTRCLPERGNIGIFNRSYYEEVLIARVHPQVLTGQKLPPEAMADKDFWKHRYRSINDFEKHLHRNGTHVVKFFLHLSKDEQRRRFLDRIDNPEKNWKLSPDDLKEREFWKDYQAAYETCLKNTSTSYAPWYVVPADDKENARLIVSQVVVKTLEDLDLACPQSGPAHHKELLAMRKQLAG